MEKRGVPEAVRGYRAALLAKDERSMTQISRSASQSSLRDGAGRGKQYGAMNDE
jgi:hypothetical protein